MNVCWTSTECCAVSGAPELSRCRQTNPSTHSRFNLHAEVFWLANTCYVPHSPASPVTVVSIQGVLAVAAVILEWGKGCCVCGENVGALGAVEVIVVMKLKWLVRVVAFVVKRSGVGCCGDF